MSYDIPISVRERIRIQGRLISAARRSRGMTQGELGARIGASRPTVNRLEKGDGGVALETVMTACWLLDIPADPDCLDPARRAALLAGSAGIERVRGRQGPDDDF